MYAAHLVSILIFSISASSNNLVEHRNRDYMKLPHRYSFNA